MKISPEHQRQILQIMRIAIQEVCHNVALRPYFADGAHCVSFVPCDSLMTDDSIECQYLRMVQYMFLIDQRTRVPGMDDWVMYFGFDTQIQHVFKTAREYEILCDDEEEASSQLGMVLSALEWYN